MQANKTRWVVTFNMWDKRELYDAFRGNANMLGEITSNWSPVDEYDHDRVMAFVTATSVDELAEILEIAKRCKFGDGGVAIYAESEFAVGAVTCAICSVNSGFEPVSSSIAIKGTHEAKDAMFRLTCEIESKVRELHALAISSSQKGK